MAGAGGFDPLYDGRSLISRGVVWVDVEYRLGIFGFFSHPDLTAESPHHASGNYAILDQEAALRWVHNNIAHFGGDPSNVTIFGQSAGSTDVLGLMAFPLSRGLFHRAIAESGPLPSAASLQTLAQAEQGGATAAARPTLRRCGRPMGSATTSGAARGGGRMAPKSRQSDMAVRV